jgi:hypothetical protein
MDDTLTVGGSTTVESTGTAVTQPSEQTADTGNAAPETNGSEGGEGQPSTDSGQGQTGTGRKRWSIQDEVKELRAQRRELREQVASFGQMQEELRQMREDMARRAQPQSPAKTPANFFADPEARLQALRDELKEVVAEQNRGLMEAFHTTREQEYAQQERLRESASAAEFIRSQQGYDASDDEDLIEIIKENKLDSLGPTKAANIAWALLQQSRGIGDKSLQKRQAASVQGQPPGVGFGRKTWNKSEFDQAVDTVESGMRKNPNDPSMNKLFDELMAAHKEGRVK